jgi:hypothetical protein
LAIVRRSAAILVESDPQTANLRALPVGGRSAVLLESAVSRSIASTRSEISCHRVFTNERLGESISRVAEPARDATVFFVL